MFLGELFIGDSQAIFTDPFEWIIIILWVQQLIWYCDFNMNLDISRKLELIKIISQPYNSFIFLVALSVSIKKQYLIEEKSLFGLEAWLAVYVFLIFLAYLYRLTSLIRNQQIKNTWSLGFFDTTGGVNRSWSNFHSSANRVHGDTVFFFLTVTVIGIFVCLKIVSGIIGNWFSF